ncbi:FecR domain-containing protein [Acidobacteria bacterium AH-259-O06]|nr:FecR domain-containing protein [Acidobacteria bacterium AH-259-O06]
MRKSLFNSRRQRLLHLSIVVLFYCSIAVPAALAASHPSRVSAVEGIAAVSHQGQVDWSEVVLNFPVWEGDRFVLQENSRLEIELNDGSFLRFGPGTDVVFQELSREGVALKLLLGDLILRTNASTLYVIFSASTTVYVEVTGLYRFSLTGSGKTTVSVRKGIARTVYNGTALSLYAGDSFMSGGAQNGLAQASEGSQDDSFSYWSDRQDAARVSSSSGPYLSDNTYAGVHDLHRYGQWGYVSSYGRVWWPFVSVNWIPYQRGCWIRNPFGGFVWVSYEPWGWLPYHYGQWTFVPYHSRWCWVPRGFSKWSPAHVSFYYGNGFVGWAPKTYLGTPGVRAPLDRQRKTGGLTLVSRERFLGRRISPERIVRDYPIHSLRPGLPSNVKTSLPVGSGDRLVMERPGIRSILRGDRPKVRQTDPRVRAPLLQRPTPASQINRSPRRIQRSPTLRTQGPSPLPKVRQTHPRVRAPLLQRPTPSGQMSSPTRRIQRSFAPLRSQTRRGPIRSLGHRGRSGIRVSRSPRN